MKAKYYEALAKAIKENLIPIGQTDVYLIYRINQFIITLCAILKADNPLFDAKKFTEAVK